MKRASDEVWKGGEGAAKDKPRPLASRAEIVPLGAFCKLGFAVDAVPVEEDAEVCPPFCPGGVFPPPLPPPVLTSLNARAPKLRRRLNGVCGVGPLSTSSSIADSSMLSLFAEEP